jgi:hypothetical protein
MANRKNLLEDAATEQVLAAGKGAAKRAVLDLLSSDEERSKRDAENEKASQQRRRKLIVGGVIVLFLVIGIIGMLVSYWQWFLLLGLVGVAAFIGWRWIRRRVGAPKKKGEAVRVEAPPAPEATTRAPRISQREAEEKERDARARAEAEAAKEQAAVEDELAQMKARIRGERPGRHE